jgi:hypothetical protein
LNATAGGVTETTTPPTWRPLRCIISARRELFVLGLITVYEGLVQTRQAVAGG